MSSTLPNRPTDVGKLDVIRRANSNQPEMRKALPARSWSDLLSWGAPTFIFQGRHTMNHTTKRAFSALVAGSLLFAACSKDSPATTEAGTTEAVAETTAATASETTGPTATETTTAAATPTEASAPVTEAAAGGNEAAAGGAAATCAAGKTIAADKLTIGTGEPAFPPYVIDNKPESGQGFEAAVAQAVAKQLGFDAAKTTWVRTPFDAVIAPGAKDFDFNLQQFTITDERKNAVDFSDGYYTAPQAVFGLANSKAANAKSVADLKGLKIGVATGTTSLKYLEETIKPTQEPLVYNDNAAAKVALESNQIDAVISDLPTALFITGVEIEGSKVFGQIAGTGTDQFGLLLAKGSKLTECVNLALGEMKSSGELDTITAKWMSEFTSAPIIAA
jgi:polar amino acid transport system substrate-binding protein